MYPTSEDSKRQADPASTSMPVEKREPHSNEPDAESEDVLRNAQNLEEKQLKAYAHLLDSAIRLPGGFRIGLDGIVGLVPGIGDLLGAFLSGYLIYGASKLDIPRGVIGRMVVNTIIETVIGLIPIIGDAFDFIFKANERNIVLLHAALEARDAERQISDKQHGASTKTIQRTF